MLGRCRFGLLFVFSEVWKIKMVKLFTEMHSLFRHRALWMTMKRLWQKLCHPSTYSQLVEYSAICRCWYWRHIWIFYAILSTSIWGAGSIGSKIVCQYDLFTGLAYFCLQSIIRCVELLSYWSTFVASLIMGLRFRDRPTWPHEVDFKVDKCKERRWSILGNSTFNPCIGLYMI